MSSIKDMNIFILKHFVANINCKLSTVTDYYASHQVLCAVSDSNDLLLHFTDIKRNDNLKVITWFKTSSKNIVDICFDPKGLWLLVLCADNTIHIVPTFKMGKHCKNTNNSFSTNFITSYEIPMPIPSQLMPCHINMHDKSCFPQKKMHSSEIDLSSSNDISVTPTLPTCVTWWNTHDNRNRAVIGYSNGKLIFFGLDANIPFTASKQTGSTSVGQLLIYKDIEEKSIILLVTLQNKEQYRIILEQYYNDYKLSTKMQNSMSESTEDYKATKIKNCFQDENSDQNRDSTNSPQICQTIIKNINQKESSSGSTTKNKNTPEKDYNNIGEILKQELINNINGCIYVTQHIRNISFLSVLDSESNTLSVHHVNSNLLPLFRYKVPPESREILITSNILYSIQKPRNTDNILRTTITLLSSALASVKDNSEKFEYQNAVLSSFNFDNENVINVHRKASFFYMGKENTESCDMKQTSMQCSNDYHFYSKKHKNVEYSRNEEFQKIIFEPCYVVTNRNIYYVDIRKEPLKLIIDAALAGLWTQCEQFCNTFNIPFTRCLEFVGDHLLQNKKVNQALLSFNIVKIPPVRTALKLAINRENYPLMHLCAMALKHVYITKSKYLNSPLLKTLFKKIQNLHVEDVIKILPKRRRLNEHIIDGQHCSDHIYCQDDSVTSLQMTLSSQFHLSNLMLITLAEKAVRDHNYIPLWNFLGANGKYHTHMTSIVLAQSGLHSSALVLAMSRGCFIEVFIALTSVVNQEFGVYSEVNVCLYTMSDPIFLECLLYLQHVSEQYLNTVQKKLSVMKMSVLSRLEKQFCPFQPIFRSMFEKYYLEISEENDCVQKDYNFISFFSSLIETYLAIIIYMHKNNSEQCNILNAFSTFNLEFDDPKLQFISNNFSPLAVGYTHCTCVIDGVAYFWGSNGVPTVFSIQNFQDINEPCYIVKRLDLLKELNLEVYAVKCGRQHTMILTNNGIFTIGSNQLYQLGIGKNIVAAQHPILVKSLDYKNITLFDAGQYHNAVIADDKLYTWGWGLYGQLGHGNTENVAIPTVVTFFNSKKIINMSLGHAHSLILCNKDTYTELYVFGSNHFGQLGLGIEKQTKSKILTPFLLNIGEKIILIQTKFFSNLAVTDNNELYTWGLSPQALRLENQNKKRANTKQKLAASLTKEIRRRVAVEIKGRVAVDHCSSIDSNSCETRGPNSCEQQNISKDCHNCCWTTTDENNFVGKQKLSTDNNQKCQFTDTQSKEFIAQQQHVGSSNMDHMTPCLVDIQKISGNISYMATGLFHFAVISSNNFLYTWGRNFDHQLGNQDKERKYIYAPEKVVCIDYALYVECGADFTVVLTKENIVKAFGGNANGQCGLDIKQSLNNSLDQNRLLCLPITKRFMRFETQSVLYPHNIDLPRPKTNLHCNTSKHFKALPKYSCNIINKIHLIQCKEKNQLLPSKTYQNLPIFDAEEFNQISNDRSDKCFCNTEETEYTCRLSYPCLSDYIHYCLFVFHNLYNPTKVMNLAKTNLEYHIRILLLNLDLVEAFKICLMKCHSAQNATRIFQYFTKNANIVPIKPENFKIYIYGLFNHFLVQNFDMRYCELFFLLYLDYYLEELFFVLFLNSGISKLTNILKEKLDDCFKIQNSTISFDAIDLIFEKVSIKFKTLVCQNIMKSLNG